MFSNISGVNRYTNAATESAIWSIDIHVKSREARSKNKSTTRIFEAWQCQCYQVFS